MEFKDIKVGDKVRLNQKLTRAEIKNLIEKRCLPDDTPERLLEVKTVKGKQGRDSEDNWESVTLEGGCGFYWPVELFESAGEVKVELGFYALKGIAKKIGLEPEDITLIRVESSRLYIKSRSGVTATLDYCTEG